MAADLLQEHEAQIEGLTLVPSDGGRFEVQVDGRLIYSKLESGRHAEPGEVMRLVEEVLGP